MDHSSSSDPSLNSRVPSIKIKLTPITHTPNSVITFLAAVKKEESEDPEPNNLAKIALSTAAPSHSAGGKCKIGRTITSKRTFIAAPLPPNFPTHDPVFLQKLRDDAAAKFAAKNSVTKKRRQQKKGNGKCALHGNC